MITRRHLLIFKAVAETKSMSKAAKILYISQPTISQKISEIENFYHIKLFERYSKTLMITEMGAVLLEKAKLVLSSFEEIDMILSGIEEFPLRIGATLTIGSTLIAPLLRLLVSEYPDVKLQVFVDNSHIIEEKILNNQLDVALIEGKTEHLDIVVQPVIHDKLIFVCAKGYLPEEKVFIKLTELSHYNFIDREEGSGTREQLDSYLKQNHVEIEPSWQCHSWEAVKQAVLYRHGIAIVPTRLVEGEIRMGLLDVINVDNIILQREFSICYHKNKALNDKMNAFIDICKTYSDSETF